MNGSGSIAVLAGNDGNADGQVVGEMGHLRWRMNFMHNNLLITGRCIDEESVFRIHVNVLFSLFVGCLGERTLTVKVAGQTHCLPYPLKQEHRAAYCGQLGTPRAMQWQ